MVNGVPSFSEILFLFLLSFCPMFYRLQNLYHLSSDMLILLPAQVCWAPLVKFSFLVIILFNFKISIFLDLYFLSLFWYHIWWDVVIIRFFNSLRMTFFKSLSMFIIVALKSLLTPTSGSPQVQFLFPPLCLMHGLLFLWIAHISPTYIVTTLDTDPLNQ